MEYGMWRSQLVTSPSGETFGLSVRDPREVKATLLMFAGFTSKRMNSTNTRLADQLEGFGVRCVAADLSGHGDSPGRIEDQTVVKASSEMLDLIEWLKKEYPTDIGSNLGIVGNSFSANAAIIAAAHSDAVSALALKSPVTDYVLMRTALLGRAGMKQWERDGSIVLPDGTRTNWSFIEDARRVDTYKLLGDLRADVIAVFGSADEEIPLVSREKARDTLEKSGKKCVVIPGGDHNLSDPYFSDVIRIMAQFVVASFGLRSL